MTDAEIAQVAAEVDRIAESFTAIALMYLYAHREFVCQHDLQPWTDRGRERANV